MYAKKNNLNIFPLKYVYKNIPNMKHIFLIILLTKAYRKAPCQNHLSQEIFGGKRMFSMRHIKTFICISQYKFIYFTFMWHYNIFIGWQMSIGIVDNRISNFSNTILNLYSIRNYTALKDKLFLI